MNLNKNQYALLLTGSGNVTIDWGDGTIEQVPLTADQSTHVHTYATVNRYQIELRGPGIVQSVEAVGTEKSVLEEINSFGEVGLQAFNHKTFQATTVNQLEVSALTKIPEAIPTTLKDLRGLLAYLDNPPVKTTFTWDWKNLTKLGGFLKKSKNFEFVWKDLETANLQDLNQFADRAEKFTFYADNVKLTNQYLDTYGMFSNSKESSISWRRSTLNAQNVGNMIQNSYAIDVNIFELNLPSAMLLTDFLSAGYNAKIRVNGLNAPEAIFGVGMFRMWGSQYAPSNDPGYGAVLDVANLNIPKMIALDNMMSGWTDAKLTIALPDLTTVSDHMGMFAFLTDCQVTCTNLRLGKPSTNSELIRLAVRSTFDLTGLVLTESGTYFNLFTDNETCTFTVNGLHALGDVNLTAAFGASENITVKMDSATFDGNCNLTGMFNLLSANSNVRANNWTFNGNTNLTGMFAGMYQGTKVEARNWTFNGTTILSNLVANSRPLETVPMGQVLSQAVYSGLMQNRPSINLTGWTFNGPAKTSEPGADASLNGLFTFSHNIDAQLQDWTFNGPARIALGKEVRSSGLALDYWKFNDVADLTRFCYRTGMGNFSPMTITAIDWTFNVDKFNIADEAFAQFGIRASSLFGDKPIYPISLAGLATWTRQAFDSKVDISAGIGPEVVDFDINNL